MNPTLLSGHEHQPKPTGEMNWRPDPRLPPYYGPYPIREMENARWVLIRSLGHCSNIELEKLKPKIGISSRFGPGIPLRPPRHHTPYSRPPHERRSAPLPHTTFRHGSHFHSKNSSFHESHSPRNSPHLSSPKNSPSASCRTTSSPETPGEIAYHYKCDYCSYTNASLDKSRHHLMHTHHTSASEYRVKLRPGGSSVLLAVTLPVALTNDGSHAPLAVVCPFCKGTFADIFACGRHTRSEHSQPRDCYSVCSVVKEHEVSFWGGASVSCGVCATTFPSHDGLHQHWREQATHDPVTSQKPDMTFALITCPLERCAERFSDAASLVAHTMRRHIENKLDADKLDELGIEVAVQYVMEPKQTEYLPPDDQPRTAHSPHHSEGCVT